MPRLRRGDGLLPRPRPRQCLPDRLRQGRTAVSQADLVLAVGSKGMYGGYFGRIAPPATVIQVNPKPTQSAERAPLSIRAAADEVDEVDEVDEWR